MQSRQTEVAVQVQTEKQALVQTPVQVLLARLLELPVTDLKDRITNEMTENPALEGGDDASEEAGENEGENLDHTAEGDNPWDEGNQDNYDNEEDLPVYQPSQANYTRPAEVPSSAPSFFDSLISQLGEHDLTDTERQIIEYLIGSLDADGLMRKPLYTVIDELALYVGIDVPEEEVERCLKVLQGFDPVGIAATSFQECFLLQLKSADYRSPYKELEQKIISQSFDDFANKRLEHLAARYKLQIDEVRTIYEDMRRRLNPRPGGAASETVEGGGVPIIPDFIVREDEEGRFDIRLAGDDIPALYVSRSYRETLDEYSKNRRNLSKEQQDAYVYTKSRIDAAQVFINAVKQRRDTLLRTMEVIVSLQQDFFHEGDEQCLHPMILRDVAERCGYDISTVSRVSSSKYVDTEFGVYPLKFFFNNSFTNTDGEEVSKFRLKNALKEIIDGEDKNNPLSDDVLAEIMKEKGFDVARRTIAKYRSQMGIPVARLRK